MSRYQGNKAVHTSSAVHTKQSDLKASSCSLSLSDVLLPYWMVFSYFIYIYLYTFFYTGYG